MTGQAPIRIDRFRSDATRVRSGIVARQYRMSMTMAAMLLAASCLVLLGSQPPEAPAKALGPLASLFAIN